MFIAKIPRSIRGPSAKIPRLIRGPAQMINNYFHHLCLIMFVM